MDIASNYMYWILGLRGVANALKRLNDDEQYPGESPISVMEGWMEKLQTELDRMKDRVRGKEWRNQV